MLASMTLSIQSLRSERAGPFDLTVQRGHCVAITGASGSGKSVFLRLVADLDPATGTVVLDGIDRGSVPAPVWRGRVCLVPAQAGWWSERVTDHLPTARLAAASRLSADLHLPDDILQRRVLRLSSGERQRLALIRALVGDPAVLLLDEPTASLDSDGVAAVEAVLRQRMANGTTIVLVTHDPAQAKRLGQAQWRMVAGKLSTP